MPPVCISVKRSSGNGFPTSPLPTPQPVIPDIRISRIIPHRSKCLKNSNPGLDMDWLYSIEVSISIDGNGENIIFLLNKEDQYLFYITLYYHAAFFIKCTLRIPKWVRAGDWKNLRNLYSKHSIDGENSLSHVWWWPSWTLHAQGTRSSFAISCPGHIFCRGQSLTKKSFRGSLDCGQWPSCGQSFHGPSISSFLS